MAKKNFSYKEAMQEVQEIVYKIENENPDVDELSAMIKKAAGLITGCKQKLKATEEDLNSALNQIEEN